MAFIRYVLICSQNLPTHEAVVADQGVTLPDPGSFDLFATLVKIGFVVIGSVFVFAIIRGGRRPIAPLRTST